MIFPDQDSTSFPIGVKNNLNHILNDSDEKYTKKNFLKYHQYVIYQYLIKNEKARGMLLFHETGTGKSISAVAIAEYYRIHDPSRKIVVLLSKSLQENFKKNIYKFIKEQIGESYSSLHDDQNNTAVKSKKSETSNSDKLSETQIDEIINDRYKFVSLNASNMFTQITMIEKTKEEIALERQLNEFINIVSSNDFLENSILIVDEFHNLSNSITNGSSNAVQLYDIIMKTKNIKLLFLTGTPIVNNPFELVPTFNMIRGPIQSEYFFRNEKSRHASDIKSQTTLFPELQVDFDRFFVDNKKNKIKNNDRFQNRIFGMVSYYGNMYFGEKIKDGFPQELPIKVEKVAMSSEQFNKYNDARDSELDESTFKGRPVASERFAVKGNVSSYRVKTRQASNYLIPEYALGPAIGKKARHKYIEKITDSDLSQLNKFSPKFGKILHNIKQYKNQLGLVYSEFVNGEGLLIFARVLENAGFSEWQKDIDLQDDNDAFDIDIYKSPKNKSPKNKSPKNKSPKNKEFNDKKNLKYKPGVFAIISGDVSFENRSTIVKIFNSDENISGNIISLLLISKTGAEGLDLKNVRHIHICEPYWNIARIDQIIARGVRYKSHEALDKSQQTVQPYIYLSDYPETYDLKKKKEETTDVELYTNSIKNKFLIDQFLVSLAEASIDCSIHKSNFSKTVSERINCKMCAPTNVKLYNPVLYKDMLLKNPCEELIENDIKANEIDINGTKYYYTVDSKKQFNVLKYDNEIQGYVYMTDTDPMLSDIMKKLLKI